MALNTIKVTTLLTLFEAVVMSGQRKYWRFQYPLTSGNAIPKKLLRRSLDPADKGTGYSSTL